MGKQGKNLHLNHLEEVILEDGSEGADQAIKILKDLGNYLDGEPGQNIAITTKYDGAPAIICGTDPSDGQFFVGTKSVFNVANPKICKSKQDCIRLYDGTLAQKLSDSYEYLKGAGIKGVLQGDLMFTNDKQIRRIKERKYITFRPNTITYAVDPESKMGKKIQRASLGIVFHTKYTGKTLPEMKSSFDVKETDYKETDRTWITTATYKNISGAASFNTNEQLKYQASIRMAEGSIKKTGTILDDIQSGKKPLKIDTEFKKFFNTYVKLGQPIPSVDQGYDDFLIHLGREYNKAINKVQRLETQAKKADLFLQDLLYIDEHKSEFKMLIATYMNLQRAKNMVVDKLKRVKKLNLFVDTPEGDYKVTDDEGYVAIQGRTAVKLIDRLEFSRLNFTVPKQWDK